MAEEVEKAEETSAGEPNGTECAVDYRAKYEELLKHSRDWERKAKGFGAVSI